MAGRIVFFVSDQTGVTAETMGHSLLTQFDSLEIRAVTLPFVSTLDKAEEAVRRIDSAGEESGQRPIVFSTLVQDDLREVLRGSNALFLDFFEAFVGPMEQELGTRSTHRSGRAHGIADAVHYAARIDATNYALANDDGSQRDYSRADVILVGVSRSGKTPTSLYLAMQHGLKAANYPLIPEDFDRRQLPPALVPHRQKIFGLSIHPDRLAEIRAERRPNSRYASIENCRMEVSEAEAMMRRSGIRWLSTTTKSIEEIATTILQEIKPERLIY